MVAYAEEYSVPFPNYLDRKSFQRVAKYGMLIRNHDVNESAELVSFDFLYKNVSFMLWFSSNISSFKGCHGYSKHGLPT